MIQILYANSQKSIYSILNNLLVFDTYKRKEHSKVLNTIRTSF